MSEQFNWVMGALLPYINFTLFIIMAVYFFRKPLNAMASKRRSEYENLFAEAKTIKEDAERQKQELDSRLRSLDDEIKSMIENARKTAANEQQAAINSAKQLAEHLTAEVTRVAEAELENALRDLRATIVTQVATQVTDKFKQELDKNKQTALVDNRIEKIQGLELGKAH